MSRQWSNWSGKVTAHPAQIALVADEAAVVDWVRRASREDLGIRCVGAAHSHAPLVATDDIVLDLSALDGVLEVGRAGATAEIAAGSRISALGPPLREAGLALLNQGDIDRQAIAGAAATGTHGTGPTLQNFSAAVVGARIVLASGDVVDCDATHEPDLFSVARLSLGAVGVVTRLRLALRTAYRLEERMWREDLDAVLERIGDLTTATRHFEFFWLPGHQRAACKSLAETDEPPRYPLAGEGRRLAWSYEVLANDRPDKHTEMEYSIPAAAGPDCLRALRELIQDRFPDLAWPLEYRTLAADDVWLSTAYRRPTVTISVHQGVEFDEEPLFRACEEVFRSYAGRPHWGKLHYLTGAELSGIHERWADWWAARDRHDPEGRFLNSLLSRWRDA